MNFLDAFILGVVEGVTEFLPVSSTGHLILASVLLKLSDTNFLKTFEIAIQLGAILSVVVLYAKSMIQDRVLLQKVIVAFLPTAVIGLVAYSAVKEMLGSEQVVLAALFLGGGFLILFEWNQKRRKEGFTRISYKQAVIIGLCQSIALIPGVSRSAATIIGGLLLGIDRKTIVEFSFLLAVPTMGAATALDIYKSARHFSTTEFELLAIGFIVSFVVALLSIKFLLRYIQTHSFISFGIYRIAIAIVFWVFVL
jgi:undecaprenyl-diphosphatase